MQCTAASHLTLYAGAATTAAADQVEAGMSGATCDSLMHPAVGIICSNAVLFSFAGMKAVMMNLADDTFAVLN